MYGRRIAIISRVSGYSTYLLNYYIFQLALLLGKPSFLVVGFEGTTIPGIFNEFSFN